MEILSRDGCRHSLQAITVHSLLRAEIMSEQTSSKMDRFYGSSSERLLIPLWFFIDLHATALIVKDNDDCY
jgi:hypothetical protein